MAQDFDVTEYNGKLQTFADAYHEGYKVGYKGMAVDIRHKIIMGAQPEQVKQECDEFLRYTEPKGQYNGRHRQLK